MIAYKFLDTEQRGAFSGKRFSLAKADAASEWVDAAEGPLEPCRNGVHACTREALVYWIAAELWEIELGGEQITGPQSVIARRGRLLRRIEAFGKDVLTPLGHACVARMDAQFVGADAVSVDAEGFAGEARKFAPMGYGQVTAYAAALACANLERGDALMARFHAERQEQSLLLAQLLGL